MCVRNGKRVKPHHITFLALPIESVFFLLWVNVCVCVLSTRILFRKPHDLHERYPAPWSILYKSILRGVYRNPDAHTHTLDI